MNKSGEWNQLMDADEATGEIGRKLAGQLERRTPSLFESRWWEDQILAWAVDDHAICLQMLRFADVLPVLKNHGEIARHLEEYYLDVKRDYPDAQPLSLIVDDGNVILNRALAWNARNNLRRIASRFLSPLSADQLLHRLRDEQRHGFTTAFRLRFPQTLSEQEADAARDQLLNLLSHVAPRLMSSPQSSQIDAHLGELVPQLQLELPLSQLCGTKPRMVDFEGTAAAIEARLLPILTIARQYGVQIQFPAELSEWNPLTRCVLENVFEKEKDEERIWFGVDLDVGLRDAEQQLEEWLKFAAEKDESLQIRLVKSVRLEEERHLAARNRRPNLAWETTAEVDRAFESLCKLLFTQIEHCRPVFAVHDLRAISHVIACAEAAEVSPSDFEFQMRTGIAGDLALLLVEEGYQVRKSCGVADPLVGMSLLAKEMLENPSTINLLHQNFTLQFPVEERLEEQLRPQSIGQETIEGSEEHAAMKKTESETETDSAPVFQPEPLTDFSDADSRKAMAQAISLVEDRLGEDYFPIIQGRIAETRNSLVSRNPSKRKEVIGNVAAAGVEEVAEAVDAAVRASHYWAQEAPQFRAEYLELLARELRLNRLELTAWIILEAGKLWQEADAEVAAAIDDCFCFAQTIRQLTAPHGQAALGEQQELKFRPRGVAAVISSFESPLGSLVRMMAAALVTGNTVVLKPSRRTPVIAARLMSMIQTVGFPDGVINCLPGTGEEIGLELVRNSQVNLVVFSGTLNISKQIHLAVAEEQDQELKPVIAEIHSSCPVLIDDDADLDETIPGILQTAFGFAGQHALNCSQVIVSKGVRAKFLKRFEAAVSSLKPGPAKDPATTLGPMADDLLIDEMNEYDDYLTEEDVVIQPLDLDELDENGFFAAPWILTEVEDSSPHTERRLPGPGIAVISVADFDEGLALLHRIPDADAAVIYSRSPAHLQQAKEELTFNHLYLNRSPGDPQVLGTRPLATHDLRSFMIPVTITENHRRRGMTTATPLED